MCTLGGFNFTFFFLWQSSGSGLVTAYADGNALRELSQSLKYHTWLRSDVEAWVAPKVVEPTTSAITRFYRVRVIRVCKDTQRLSCSCGFFSRHGFPCRHLYIILKVTGGGRFSFSFYILMFVFCMNIWVSYIISRRCVLRILTSGGGSDTYMNIRRMDARISP